MKVIIFHGYKGSPSSLWLPYAKTELEKRGHAVLAPSLPYSDPPDLSRWLPFAEQSFTYTDDTVLIGHSSGGALVLSILERLDVVIRQAIFVAAFYEPLQGDARYPILQARYDWDRIRAHCREFVCVNSDNDPWGADERVGRSLTEKLGGTFVMPKGAGHMGSIPLGQPYPEFPLLVRLVAEK